MKTALKMCAAIAALLLPASVAGATTYTSAQRIADATVDFSLTTNGVIGPVSENDVTAFNIDITDPSGSVDLTETNSRLDFFAMSAPIGSDTSALVATPTELTYDFDTPGSGYAYFYEAASVTQTPFYCLSTSGCFVGQDGLPAIGVSTQFGNSPTEQINEIGTVVIASAAPEPSTWLLIMVGAGGLGLMLRRVRKDAGLDLGAHEAYSLKARLTG